MLRGAAQIPPLLAQLKQQAGNGLSLCRRGDAVRAAKKNKRGNVEHLGLSRFDRAPSLRPAAQSPAAWTRRGMARASTSEQSESACPLVSSGLGREPLPPARYPLSLASPRFPRTPSTPTPRAVRTRPSSPASQLVDLGHNAVSHPSDAAPPAGTMAGPSQSWQSGWCQARSLRCIGQCRCTHLRNR